jgi:citrate synthase
VPVYRALGIPDPLSTLVFATGRMAGWTAHILEQYADNRLIRPRAAYDGVGARVWPKPLHEQA